MGVFGLSDVQMLGHGIKLIDGIAGSAKSSNTHNFFTSRSLDYRRYTSTNRLSRDASERYNMEVKTIAAGLFHNHGRNFYAEEKDPTCENIVIDEILQTDPRAIDWCINHADDTNIIITTDSKQLLSPENDHLMKSKLQRLKDIPSTISTEVTTTLRARTDATRDIYYELYDIADSEMTFNLDALMTKFSNVIEYKDMIYTPDNAYITHDNLTEDFLYKDQEFLNNPMLDLIPKGCISSNPPKNLRAYPILSQMEADRMRARSYTQVMNVGSAVRFQGSEVMDTQKLYYIVQPGSIVTARELYTVVTRMWDINSFVIVICETPKRYKLTAFNGLPVKTHKYLTLKGEDKTIPLSDKEMDDFVGAFDTEYIYYDRDVVHSNKGVDIYIRKGTKQEAFTMRKTTAGSLARRDARLNYSYIDQVYKIFEEHDLKQGRAIHKMSDRRNSESFEVDIFSAYPTILKYENIPSDGFIKTDRPHDDMMNFYVYDGEGKFTVNSIITDDLHDYLEEKYPGHSTYLFSTPYIKGSIPGDWLFNKVHDTKESKMDAKNIHYGYYQKPYLKKSLMGDCYVRYENHIYEILICHIFSQLLFYMMQIKDALDGTAIIVDAVQFPCYNEETVGKIKAILPDYFDFRIRNKEKGVLFQTYEDLPTKDEKKKAYMKEYMRKRRATKKEVQHE